MINQIKNFGVLLYFFILIYALTFLYQELSPEIKHWQEQRQAANDQG